MNEKMERKLEHNKAIVASAVSDENTEKGNEQPRHKEAKLK